jgi:hypothetical protein
LRDLNRIPAGATPRRIATSGIAANAWSSVGILSFIAYGLLD